MIPRVTATVDTLALKQNLATVRQLAPQSKILSVVKADAYGHGVTALLPALSSADALAVARIDEAVQLRSNGFEGKIILLSGVLTLEELHFCATQKFDLVVHDEHQLKLLDELTPSESINIWLKFDSGMNRLGFKTQQAYELAINAIERNSSVNEIVLMTHFASADDNAKELTLEQIATFDRITRRRQYPVSMANSGAIIQHPSSYRDWVRPGLMMYGVNPVESSDVMLEPVMTLSSVVIAVKEVQQGQGVGYGHSWHAKTNTNIAVVAIGYADGIPRSLSNTSRVFVKGKYYPIVGRVSMDMMTIDLGSHHDVKVGDVVELWGNNVPVTDVADAASTIPYELMVNLASRVKIVIK